MTAPATEDRALVTSAVDPEIAAAMQIAGRLNPLKDALGIRDLTDQEVQLFAMVSRRSGLDPFAKQIYAIKRKGKVSYQVGIDGYRSIAARTTEYAGSEEATYEDCPCGEAPKGHPAVARVVVRRIHASGRLIEQTGVARWHELKPAPGEFNADARWIQMPFNQLAKCAEANGLRKLFPTVLADIYIEDEMAQAGPPENGALAKAATQPTASQRIAARRQAVEEATAPETDAGDVVEGTAAEIPTETEQEAPAAASTPPPAERATPPKAAGQGKPSLCLVTSPYGDGQACGLPKGHAEKLHKSLDQDGSLVASWE